MIIMNRLMLGTLISVVWLPVFTVGSPLTIFNIEYMPKTWSIMISIVDFIKKMYISTSSRVFGFTTEIIRKTVLFHIIGKDAKRLKDVMDSGQPLCFSIVENTEDKKEEDGEPIIAVQTEKYFLS